MLGAAVGLLVARERRRAAVLVAGTLVVAGGAFAWLEHASGGWFGTYVFAVPGGHGLDARYVTLFFVSDLAQGFALTGATAGIIAMVARSRSGEGEGQGALVFTAVLVGAFCAAATSRMHVGGYVNVLMPWATLACVAFGVVASRLEARTQGTVPVVLVLAAALLQLMRFAYDPGEAIPTAAHVRAADALVARVRELEKDGDVMVHGQGHLTAHPHFHAVALQDLLRAGMSMPESIARAFRERRFAAFVIDDFDELTLDHLRVHTDLFTDVTSSYYVAERFDDRDPPHVVGWAPHPSWVLRPRVHRLEGWTEAALRRRQGIEAALAEERMRLAREGARVPVGSIEDEAARMDVR
jgi:hypothetical protein